MRAQEIIWNWSTKNIFKQNEKFKRFRELLIEKAKYIKKHAKLSKNFYLKCYLVVVHILNRTSSSILNWNLSLIFMQKLLKNSIRNEIVHFKMFNCKMFSFFKKINAFKKNKKNEISCTFIEYLIKYDFTNIFRIWNLKKDDVKIIATLYSRKRNFSTRLKQSIFSKKKEKRFYVTYRAISLQIFEKNDEK
jgi:hypothetical protein